MRSMLFKAFFAIVFCSLFLSTQTNACTRVLYVGDQNTVITGRNMDWSEDMGTNLWVFPRGIERNGEAGPNSPTWKAKYGSIVASAYEMASVDGMNEKGLVINLLYLAESDYGTLNPGELPLSISLWGQYVLDNFASVSEAVTSLQNKPLHMIAPSLPNGEASTVHLSISDISGDSAIFEYINGKLVIHHGKKYQVMTNSPIYSKQLAINEYWQNIDGTVFLPGTNRAADRFARASFFLKAVPKNIDNRYIKGVPDQSFGYQALAEVLSIMRSVSVPLGITTPNQPNIASTLWRVAADQKNLVYFFDSSTRPNTFWLSLSNVDFSEKAPVLKLELDKGQVYSGEVSREFKPAPAFKFMSVQ